MKKKILSIEANIQVALSVFIVFAMVFLVCTRANAAELLDRLEVTMGSDSDGYISSEIFVPVYWNDAFFSGVGYRSKSSGKVSRPDSMKDSKISENCNEQMMTINAINLISSGESVDWSVGVNIDKIIIDRSEIGYLNLNGNSEVSSIDNQVEIVVDRVGLTCDLAFKRFFSESARIRTGILVSPVTELEVSQSTMLKPYITEKGDSKNSAKQNTSYEFFMDYVFMMNENIGFGLKYRHSFLSLEYNANTIKKDGSNASSYNFEVEKIDQEEQVKKAEARLIFRGSFLSMNPVIGFAYEEKRLKDNRTGNSVKDDSKLIVIGFENKF